MKRNRLAIFLFLAMFLATTGCKNYDDLVKNPNLPISLVPPSLLLTSTLNKFGDDLAWTQTMQRNQYFMSTFTYYGTNNYDQAPFTNSTLYYTTLENVVRMEIEAKNAGMEDVNPYSALGKFFRAYFLNLMSQKLGDLPVTDALQGLANPTPKYNTQKELYLQVLAWLDQANADLATLITKGDASLAGDIYLNNNLEGWQKVVNAYTLRVLISLSQKESDPDLKIKEKFAAIVSNPAKYPVLTSLSDNLQFRYNAAYVPYPKTPGNYKQTNYRENISATILNLTTSTNDPRTYVIATPAPVELAAGKTVKDFSAYVGANPGDDMGTLGNNSQAGKYSFENMLRYASTNDGSNAEPAIIVGYPELCFNIAEGINRGWASGNAGNWYLNGIKASLDFLGVTEGATLTIADKDQTVLGTVQVSVTDFLAQPSIQYKGDNADGLTQILNQKYIAFWQNSNWEPFFNQRRTGIPQFLTGPGTGNNKKLPLRWQYPYSEVSANSANYQAALKAQFNGQDNINGRLWINQP